jgi:hypothetical protein
MEKIKKFLGGVCDTKEQPRHKIPRLNIIRKKPPSQRHGNYGAVNGMETMAGKS